MVSFEVWDYFSFKKRCQEARDVVLRRHAIPRGLNIAKKNVKDFRNKFSLIIFFIN